MPRSPTPSKRKPRRASGGITLTDVAKLAGVSAITVSRALNDPGMVSAETLESVRNAVKRTGYTPNLLAGGLASARSRLVAAVVPTMTGPMFMETIEALTESLSERGYQLMIGQSGYQDTREERLLDAIIGRRPDGIVLTGVAHSARGRQRLAAAGIPVVETWDFIPTPIDMLVGFTHDAIGPQVARLFADKGKKQVAALSSDDERAKRRSRSFAAAAAAHGIAAGGSAESCCEWLPALTSIGIGRRGLTSLLKRLPHVDAVFCSSDVVAQGVLAEANSAGIRIPGDLAVLGFGDLAFAAELHPALSTVRVDGAAIGRLAGGLIMDRVEGKAVDRSVIDVGFTIVERATT